MAFFNTSVPNEAKIEPTTMKGAMKSRRLHTATMLASTTSHLLAELARKTALGGFFNAMLMQRCGACELKAAGRGITVLYPAAGPRHATASTAAASDRMLRVMRQVLR